MAFSALVVFLAMGVAHAKLPDNYMSMSASAKLDTIWNLIQAGKYTSDPLPRSNLPETPLLDYKFLQGSFGQEMEEMPEGREKLVGTNGITAKAELIIYPNSSYSGVFQPSSKNTAILRLSSNTAENLVMFFAMKIFVDGNHSQNFHMIHDVLGWGIPEVDIFEWSFQTSTPAPLDIDYTSGRYSAVLNKSFTDCVFNLPGDPKHRPGNIWGLGNVEQAEIDSKGVKPQKVSAPWIVQVTPNPKIRPVKIKLASDDWRVVVTKAIPANTLLYSVTARRSPCDDFDTIGEIWTRSEFVASAYHDKTMRFGQPFTQWDYSVAAPGTKCDKDPNGLPTWPTEEANKIESNAVNPNAPPSVAQGNTNPAKPAGLANTTEASVPNIKYSTSLSGADVILQDAGPSALREGPRTTIRALNTQGYEWVHFSFPTPDVYNGDRLALGAVAIRFASGKSARIVNWWTWDGDQTIMTTSNLNLTGGAQVATLRMDNQRTLNWGVMISLGVSFDPSGQDPWIQFISAKADYVAASK